MAMFKKGDVVRQVVPVIEGTVDSYQVDQETGELQLLVVWNDENGEPQGKYFKAEELEAAV